MSSATDKKYKIIVEDPPWQYQNKASRGAAVNHYPTMSMADLLDMRVGDYADKPSVLCMWYTGLLSVRLGRWLRRGGLRFAP